MTADLDDLFEAWQTDIDSEPYAHEAECDRIVGALLKEVTP
jgi:hypothetical protein